MRQVSRDHKPKSPNMIVIGGAKKYSVFQNVSLVNHKILLKDGMHKLQKQIIIYIYML